jgi:hypothetical protein
MQAKLAAERIFSLTDRHSAIDPLDEAGYRPDDMFTTPNEKEHHYNQHSKKHHPKKSSSPQKELDLDIKEESPQRGHKHHHSRKSSMNFLSTERNGDTQSDSDPKVKSSKNEGAEGSKGLEAEKPSSGKKKKKSHHHHKSKVTKPQLVTDEVEDVGD